MVLLVDPDALNETRWSLATYVDVHVFDEDRDAADLLADRVRKALDRRDIDLQEPHRWAFIRLDAEGVPEEVVIANLQSSAIRFRAYAQKRI